MSRPPRQVQDRLMKRLDLDAIVLAGGESRRMGLPKALLPFGNTTLLGAILDTLIPLFRRVFVVARERKGLERLGVPVLSDDSPQRGPMVGVARGLAASDAPWCFVVGCDMPFLRPGVIRRMADNLDGCDILLARQDGYFLPLHAFYGQGCLPKIRELLEREIISLQELFPICRVRSMEASEFLDLDPDLLSFRDIDTPEGYKAAQTLAAGSSPQNQP